MEDLNDFLKIVAKGKEASPTHQKLKQVKENAKSDLSSLFSQLAEAKKPHKEEPIVEEVAIEEVRQDMTNALQEKIEELQSELASIKEAQSFQQPQPAPVAPDLRDITNKLKFLEQAIGKIAATGPGSGEVNFRYLDDVNRATMSSANDNWVLEYDVATKKVQFTEHIGPIRTVKFNTLGPQQALVSGQVAWNPEEDCLDIKHSDGTVLQTGLEQYIRVHNHTASTITNGTVVMFAGVENTNNIAMPIISKYIANSAISPLFLIGVLTSDIAPAGIGRATTFGYVRDLNTTGSSVGETWVQGDLLWGHPTIAGALTKVRPTAPNVATSIAAVARVGTTDGQILVRPTIWPRLYYGDWYDDATQTAALPNTAYPVKVMHSGACSGFEVNAAGTEIKALNAGRYNFEFSLQVTSTNSSLARMWIWYRQNGVDVPNSATVVTVRENGGRLAPAWNFPVLMNANDTFTLMWATDSVNVSLAAEPATAFCPAIPSVILTVSQTNL